MLGSHIVRCEQRHEWRWSRSLLDVRAAIGLLAVHQAHHAHDFKAVFARRLDGLHGRRASGTNVVDNNHSRRFLTKALDPLPGSVGLFGFAYQKSVDWFSLLRADHGGR